jgi:AbrB family transcriptional regulator, transcriptional pleiotropic regulator of transition state genes
MKDTGIIRKVDRLGRIVLPSEMRKKLSISQKDDLEIYSEGESIVLKKHDAAGTSIARELEIAREMLAGGEPLEKIIKYTKLQESDIIK